MAAAAAGIAAIAAATVLFRALGGANPTTVALSFLLVVLFVATAGPLWAALVTSLAAMLCFNFFFLPPIGTWHIHDPQNWVALAALLTTSVVASQLSESARARADARRSAAIANERAALSSALLAAMGHDLRTPLTALRVAVDNLAGTALDPAARQTQARLAQQQAGQLTRVFDEILDMARIESKSVPVRREWSAAADIVDAAIARVAPALARHRVEVDVSSGDEALVDPRLTASALAHLIENAAHYSPPGTRIAVRAWIDPGALHLSVIDQGEGLTGEDLRQLFTPLFRGRAGRLHGGGTGMGLAITRGLLAAEGGRATAENHPPHGARFSIRLPAETRAIGMPAEAP